MTLKELEKVHPDYETFLPEWKFFINSYLGGKFYRDGNYLLQHPFESTENYERRKKIAYFYNYCSPIVDIYTAYLTKNQPKRSYGNLASEAVPPRQPKTLFDSFWWDVDFEGTNFEQFMREVTRYASIYGRVSVIVDKPNVKVTTEAQALEQDIRPYCLIVTPEKLLDWKYVRLANGKTVLDMIKVKEDNGVYRIWTREKWELWTIESKQKAPVLKDSGSHDLGEIPIVNIYNKKTGIRLVGASDIQDIADINKNIYYFCSDAKEIIENTAFPMLAMAQQPSQGGEEEDAVRVGPKSIIDFDPEALNGKPFFLEAPHTSLEEIREWIQQDAQEMVRIAKMGGIRNTETSVQPWSGVSIIAQEGQLYAALAEKACNAEQGELDIFRFYSMWQETDFTGTVDYPREFGIRDLTTTLNNSITAGTAKVNSLTFEKARQKNIIDSTLPSIEENERDTMFKEIDELDKLWWRKDDKGTLKTVAPITEPTVVDPDLPVELNGGNDGGSNV